jgi:hypothetical protein
MCKLSHVCEISFCVTEPMEIVDIDLVSYHHKFYLFYFCKCRFLGHFQPQQGKPALWKLDSDQHYSIGRQGTVGEETVRPLIKRSFSVGNILCENSGAVSDCNAVDNNNANSELLPIQQLDDIREPTDSAPEIYMCETNPCSSTKYSAMPGRHSISEERQSYLKRLGYPELHSSNFLDLDLLSSSGNSCDEEAFERYYIRLIFVLPHSLNSQFLFPFISYIMAK